MRKRHLVFFVSNEKYFFSHRLPVARAARDVGMKVTVVTHIGECREHFAAEGFDTVHLPMSRAGMNVLTELRLLGALIGVYRRLRPDLVHQVAMKPVLYGSIAAFLAGVPRVVNTLTGLGFVFSSSSWKARLLRPPIRTLFRLIFSRTSGRLILQNEDDQQLFTQTGLASAARIRLICGSGVNPDVYPVSPEPEGVPVVVLPARLLRDKGIYEFVKAARLLKQAGAVARFVLVGEPDVENPAAVTPAELTSWVKEGVVEAWGWRSDMAQVFAESTLVCLPSYREGLPKSLLEAASCGRAIVTTEAPGCREVVEHGVNGLLVPARRVEPLVHALEKLLADSELRAKFGNAGRLRVLERYTERGIVQQTLAVYEELLQR